MMKTEMMATDLCSQTSIRSRSSAGLRTLLLCILSAGLAACSSMHRAESHDVDAGHGALRSATVVVVRHAEKLDSTPSSGLTPAGAARAERLAAWLTAENVSHVFSTQYERTQATVRPVAAAAGCPVDVIDARDQDQLLRRLRALPDDAVAVIAGHSNTVPDIVKALGGSLENLTEKGRLPETQYDRVIILTLGAPGDANLHALRTLDLRMPIEQP